MTERWLPIRHDRKVTVELDPPAHRVQTKDGKTYGIATLRITHRIEYNGPSDPEWEELIPILISAGGHVMAANELTEAPAWLEDIIARATPIDP